MPDRDGDIVACVFLFSLGDSSVDGIIQFKVRLKGMKLFQIKIHLNAVRLQFADSTETIDRIYNYLDGCTPAAVVDKDGKLAGLITYKDLIKERLHPNACKDAKGRLRVAAGVGITPDALVRVAALAAEGVDAVVLLGACADVYSPKASRATMGAIFRQRVLHADIPGLKALAVKNGLPLYAAALSEQAADIRSLTLKNAMVCVGSEGQGLSRELMDACDGQLIIPMTPGSESLNAAVAASLIMWEMCREIR